MTNNYYFKGRLEAGIDECGVGTLIGRVYASAVILPYECPDENFELFNLINDSKKLSEKKRYELEDYIKNIAIDYTVQYIEADEIDKINIYQAKIKAWHNTIDNLTVKPEILLIDGDYFNIYRDNEGEIIEHICISQGDSKFKCIAAASILAKCEHSRYMEELHNKYPNYFLNTNHGYGTKKHIESINKYGLTPEHRKTFSPCKNMIG